MGLGVSEFPHQTNPERFGWLDGWMVGWLVGWLVG